ncbi:2-phosphosulfolactate phosphatase [Luteibacter sp. dw_328]|jgi:2-phosphosulfolactate phosphatase|uniref:2-phosphosulfolactate phosphatase n=1 Tax=Luteibacter sp. dw_328 TaxID=2719796 RepID=UPI001BD556C1|nr:2-phosphosulfolactate phosphatase [Luteibacter sp. dw_328]
MPKLHVLLKKEELDPARLADKVVIVLDVLFATSTIVHAFGQGLDALWPARDADDARRIADGLDEPALAGEYLADELPGFGPATPLALSRTPLGGTTLVYATTNGTVALNGAAGAAHVYAGALLNGDALVSHVVAAHPEANVLLVCAGSMNHFNLEDFYGAGHLAAHFERSGHYKLSDAALAALLLYRGCDAGTALGQSRVGRMMRAHGLQHEVDYAAQSDTLAVVPELLNGCLRAVVA